GLVLDLRNDPGGLLNGAVAVSAAFLPKDVLVVYTEGRTDDAKMNLHANPRFYLRGTRNDYMEGLPADIKTVPMITLVNGGSASASEIVAGALQDHDRSVVMGSQTFGKGSVQTILPLSGETAIKLTTALYYTPNGVSIQAKGITPDIIDESDGDDLRRLREADLNRHLSNGSGTEKADKTTKPKSEPKNDDDEKEEKTHAAPIEFGSSEDLLLAKAMEYLKGETPWPEMNKDKASD
ncbi:MAG: S41 family peptidase, partial [Nitrosomonas sp.]|nr:S41 family peptidase [Nitrosomonas sp.]